MGIWRYLTRVVLLLAALQAALLAATLAFAPRTVDNNHSRRTIFQTDSKMAVYASPIVVRGNAAPQVVILGSSNTTMGLPPDKLQPYLGDVPIHNLSIGSEKFRALDQVIDLLYRQTPPENRRNYVFVIGISYPLAADLPSGHERGTGQTSVDDEEQRFALFTADKKYGSLPRIADRHLTQALYATWPFMVPKMIYNRTIRLLPEPYWFGLAEEEPFSPEQSNVVQYTKQQNQERIAYYNAEIPDTTGEYTFEPLLRAIKRVTDAGGEVVIVDLPTAQWLQRATPLYAAYAKLRKPYISRLEKMPHVRYINAESGFADEDFYDGVHPRNRITDRIAQKVAPTIRHALEELK